MIVPVCLDMQFLNFENQAKLSYAAYKIFLKIENLL